MNKVQPILIEDIRIEVTETQLRKGLDDDTVARYVEALEQGDRFPAVELVPDGDGKWLIADGWHRVFAHRTAGRKTVNAILSYVPPRADPLEVALRLALRANKKHGLPLTREDQAKRARAALKMKSFRGWSLRQLEHEIGVGKSTIGRVRKQLLETGELPWSEECPKLPSWWPAVYADVHKLFDPWEGDEELREATARLVQKLKTQAAGANDWEFVYYHSDDWKASFKEHVVLHHGIVQGETWVIPVEDNPVDTHEGRPKRSWLYREKEARSGGGGSTKWLELSQDERDKIAENQRRRQFFVALGKLKQHPHPLIRKFAKAAPKLREVPGLWGTMRELAEAGGALVEHEHDPFGEWEGDADF